jgi:hypothetical protein
MKIDLEKIIKRLDAIEKRIEAIEKNKNEMFLKAGAENLAVRKTSLREFLISNKPSDDVKRTLAVGYYLEKFDSLNSFGVKDLESAFERGKEKKPSNINDKINMNIRNGHIEEAKEKKDGRKAWYVTNSGEAYVDGSFMSNLNKE